MFGSAKILMKAFMVNLKLNKTIMKLSLQILRWTPRILCLLAILFVSMFALDSFEQGRTLWQNLGSLGMHLIPSLILIGVLIVAWKWELFGGIILTTIGISLTFFVYILNYNRLHFVGKALGIALTLCLPFVISGLLFIVSHFIRKTR